MNTVVALKALIVITSHSQLGNTGKPTGWYLPEVSHPYYQLTAAGIEVDFVSPQGGKAPMDESSKDLKDAVNARFLNDSAAVKKIENSLKPSDIDPKKYSAILFAGGHGTMWDFPDNKTLAHIAAVIYENKGVVSAVCHGPAALVNIKLSDGQYLVKGKSLATFTNQEEKEAELEKVVPFLLESKFRERGAIVKTAPNWSENVVVDGRLVTGQNPASATKLGKEVARLLTKKD